MERHFKRDLDALNDIFAFIDGFIEKDASMSSISFPLRVAVEELFVNMVSYNAEGAGDILLDMESDGCKVTTTLQDLDSDFFDIKNHEVGDLGAPLEERKIGGLGIHLVKRMMDEVYFEYKDRRTTIRLIKHLKP